MIKELFTNHSGDVYQAEALELCREVPDGLIDMILCDLPYGTTANKWDSVIPFAPMWEQFKRITKPNAAIVLTAQTPFDKALGASNLDMLKYEWIVKKEKASGFLNVKKAPLKNHESVLIFYDCLPLYNPQRTKGEPYSRGVRRNSKTSNYGKQEGKYLIENDGFREPVTVLLDCWPDTRSDKAHPTQKPIELFEYMIRTYTNPGMIVFDPTAGSGTTARAALNLGRQFIVGDSDPLWASEIVHRLNAPDDQTWAKEARARRDG